MIQLQGTFKNVKPAPAQAVAFLDFLALLASLAKTDDQANLVRRVQLEYLADHHRTATLSHLRHADRVHRDRPDRKVMMAHQAMLDSPDNPVHLEKTVQMETRVQRVHLAHPVSQDLMAKQALPARIRRKSQ